MNFRSRSSLLLGLAVVGGAAAAVAIDRYASRRHRALLPTLQPKAHRKDSTRVGRRLNLSSALLSFSVLADSGLEHYRGSFQNRAMFLPLGTSTLTLGASLFGIFDERPGGHVLRDVIYAGAAATGFAGFGFHAYNVGKRPGGLSWQNLFYAAPIGAPIAMTLAGLLGRGAEKVRDDAHQNNATLLSRPAGPVLGAVATLGLIGTVGEAALLHFRGAYHNPAMYLPIVIPPVGASLLSLASMRPTARNIAWARQALRITAGLGFIGVGFHALGIARNMGGWRNWSQNILNGPPLPAPPSFTGLAVAGLAALDLLEVHQHG